MARQLFHVTSNSSETDDVWIVAKTWIGAMNKALAVMRKDSFGSAENDQVTIKRLIDLDEWYEVKE